MNGITSRLNELIAALGIRQTEFAKRLKMSDASVSTLCSGKTKPSAQTAALICKEFGVNEDWLLNGNGEMFYFYTMSKEEQILEYVGRLVKDKDANVQRFILNFMSGLPSELWDAVEDYGKELLAEEIKKD